MIASLPKAIDMDSVSGYKTIYHVEWKGLKFIVKIARQTKKIKQPKAKWFFTPKDNSREKADYFILLCLLGNNLEAVYSIPIVFLPKVYITITKLNGNMRYSHFRTTMSGLAKKIESVQKELPELIEISKRGKYE